MTIEARRGAAAGRREPAQPPLRLGMVAGEPSGDQLGAGLMAALARRCPGVRFIGAGGPAMRAAGLDAVVPAETLTMNGLIEPLLNLPRLWRCRRQLLDAFTAAPIDGFVGIDFNAFNIGLERHLKGRGVAVSHYVSPSIYAWRPGRLRGFQRAMDQVLTLYPFEAQLYRHSPVAAVFVGHPLADELAPVPDRRALRADLGVEADDATVLAVLPGSRPSELRRLLPDFLNAAARFQASRPKVAILVAAVDAQAEAWIRAELSRLGEQSRVQVVAGRSRDVLAAADLALIKSGTGTLEAMLLGVPMVVAYRLDPVTAAVVRPLLRTPWVALPNLLAGEQLVPEFLQQAVEPEALAQALSDQLPRAGALRKRFADLAATLGQNSSGRAAGAVVDLLVERGIRVPRAA
ncbi:MAG: lipid-A-disaccharide synthase [Gammaproteobacteria bacterium]|nr:lipid-A-disaccharide synthase [Gammaproteobacteria bacterium]